MRPSPLGAARAAPFVDDVDHLAGMAAMIAGAIATGRGHDPDARDRASAHYRRRLAATASRPALLAAFDAWGLDVVSRRALSFALAYDLLPALAALIGDGGPTLDALALACGEADVSAPFAPESALDRLGLGWLDDARICVLPRLVPLAGGLVALDEALATLATLTMGAPTTALSPALVGEIHAQLAACEPVVMLLEPDQVVEDVADALGPTRFALIVDAPRCAGDAAWAIAREALLHDAVPLLLATPADHARVDALVAVARRLGVTPVAVYYEEEPAVAR